MGTKSPKTISLIGIKSTKTIPLIEKKIAKNHTLHGEKSPKILPGDRSK